MPKKLFSRFKEEISCSLPQAVEQALQGLLRFGPFPEPFLRQNERFSRKWHQDYFSLVIREDLKDISRVLELDKIEHLLLLLSPRIMAPLSMANLAGELEVAHTTVKSWLEQLRRLFTIFSVPPWTRKISRGLRREKKWYFLDWLYAPEGPARLENMVATCLFRACSAMTDMGYGNYKLYYIRTIDKREIDFVIEIDNAPMIVIEVKLSDRDYRTLSGIASDGFQSRLWESRLLTEGGFWRSIRTRPGLSALRDSFFCLSESGESDLFFPPKRISTTKHAQSNSTQSTTPPPACRTKQGQASVIDID